jgi:hypothetical protein
MSVQLLANRRQFLRGLGGVALALPFLPSLAQKEAHAGPAAPRPRFFWLGTDHGGAFDSNMFPADSMLSERADVVSGHSARAGALVAGAISGAGGTTSVSPILTAPSSALTPGLLAKMNVIRGLDVPFYIGHSTGIHLGNYARNDGNGGDGAAVAALSFRPTIDQLIAGSRNFYHL